MQCLSLSCYCILHFDISKDWHLRSQICGSENDFKWWQIGQTRTPATPPHLHTHLGKFGRSNFLTYQEGLTFASLFWQCAAQIFQAPHNNSTAAFYDWPAILLITEMSHEHHGVLNQQWLDYIQRLWPATKIHKCSTYTGLLCRESADHHL